MNIPRMRLHIPYSGWSRVVILTQGNNKLTLRISAT